jgi:hypothetical protein
MFHRRFAGFAPDPVAIVFFIKRKRKNIFAKKPRQKSDWSNYEKEQNA